MDALLLLLQLRNSLSEFGPVVIRLPPPPPPPHYHLISYAGPLLPESLLTHKTPTITPASANYYKEQGTFKHRLLHEAQLTITPKGLYIFF